jgi:phytoene dehydrogenase-like protein
MTTAFVVAAGPNGLAAASGPRITLSPCSVGLPGMYICSAATPPGPGAHGMCGYNAAQAALTELNH